MNLTAKWNIFDELTMLGVLSVMFGDMMQIPVFGYKNELTERVIASFVTPLASIAFRPLNRIPQITCSNLFPRFSSTGFDI